MNECTNAPKKKRGNPNWMKGQPSPNPRGKTGGREAINTVVVAALKNALEKAHPGGAEGYFLKLAREEPQLFCAMVQKILPTETNVSVAVSIGDAIIESQRRVEELQAKLIDITPEVVSHTLPQDKPLETNE